MGRHSASYIAAQQALSTVEPSSRRSSTYIGRVGLLAVALGIGAAVAGGTAVAGADTPSSNAGDDRASQSPTGGDTATDSSTARSPKRQITGSTRQDTRDQTSDEADGDTGSDTDRRSRADDGPASAPPSSLEGVTKSEDDAPGEEQSLATENRSSRKGGSAAAPETVALDVLPQPRREIQDTSAVSTVEPSAPVAPSPADQVTTEYGDIGKWMLEWTGNIADYGGLPYEGRTVLEPINVIFVDPTSKSALGAAWKLNAAMRRAGFPPRLFHSTGFRGLIDDRRYQQQPRGLLVGYSDDFFLVDNNHGRIFGPDPVETSSGYVWSGAFSTEELVWTGLLPRHGYVSSNMARDALAADLISSGRARLGGTVALANAYNTDTTTTGDHDGYAVVVILNQLNLFGVPINAAMPAVGAATDSRMCTAEGPATSASSPCAMITVAAGTGSR
ncbi:MAG: hypothetical protein WBB00_19145 [Mycobacterium sp.]